MTRQPEFAAADERVFNTGVTQADRMAGVPKPRSVWVDGRSPATLLAFAGEYGKLIRFYDLTNQPAGDWSAFFAADPSLRAARLLSLDIEALAADCDRILGDLRRTQSSRGRLDLALEALHGLRRMIRPLDPAPPAAEDDAGMLARVLATDRDQLFAPPLAELSERLINGDIEAFLNVAEESMNEARFDRLVALLADAFAGLTSRLARDTAAASAAFDAGQRSANHAPQAAVWNAFVQLFTQAQAALNGFPARFIDFYYQNVLRQTQTSGTPPGGTSASGAASTSPTATSATTSSSGTTSPSAAAQVVAVSNLRITRQVAATPPASGGSAYGGQVLTSTVVLSGTPPAITAPFPLFGPDTTSSGGPLATGDASLGFAIVSPTLLLAGGTRTVSIGLWVSATSLSALTSRLTAIGGSAGGLSANAVLAQILEAAFTISYSTAGGWMALPGFTVASPASGQTGPFVLGFTLPDGAAPLTALSSQPPAKGAMPPQPGSPVPSADQPTLLAQLVQAPITFGTGATAATVSPYGLLKDLELAGLSIDVTVNGLSDLGLSTSAGPVRVGQPFAPFGSPPVQNAALDIAVPELFAKIPGSLALSLAWSGPPTQDTGFQGYYQGYVIDTDGQTVLAGSLFDNTSFTGALSVVAPGLWTLPVASTATPASSPLYLFGTTPTAAATSTAATPTSAAPTTTARTSAAPTSATPTAARTSAAPAGTHTTATHTAAAPAGTHTTATHTAAAPAAATHATHTTARTSAAPAAAAPTIATPPTATPPTATSPPTATPISAAPAAAAPVLAGAALTPPAPVAQQAPPYYDPSASRLRLSLATPSYAFGNTLYAANVAAAAAQASAAAAACSQQCARSQSKGSATVASANAALSSARVANAHPSSNANARATTKAVNTAVSRLNGAALQTLRQAIADSKASSQAKGVINKALNTAAGSAQATVAPAGTHALPAAVETWITTYAGVLGSGAHGSLRQANALLTAAATLKATHEGTLGRPPSSAQAALTPALNNAQATVNSSGTTMQQCLQACLGGQATAMPNPPWLPMIASLGLNYTASTAVPASAPGAAFCYLMPFDGVATVAWPANATVPLLPRIEEDGGLYVGLSASAASTALQVVLQAPQTGWPANPPAAQWQQSAAGGWAPVTPISDTTNGLRQSGTVTLPLKAPGADSPPMLRATVIDGAGNTAQLAAVTAIAALSSGAAATPTAQAGATGPTSTGPTSTSPTSANPTSANPTSTNPTSTGPTSTGAAATSPEAPPRVQSTTETSPAFQLWMGERSRHKDAGIQSWDYGRLVLAAFPGLWQVGVAPATDATGLPAAGHVWVVLVPGPTTPNITDPTIPLADPSLLSRVAGWLAPKLSPFVQLAVTSPPYARVTITADVLFSDANPLTVSLAQLNSDLIGWLSPWPDAALGSRPSRYYTRHWIAEFVRHRPYVRGIASFHVAIEMPPGDTGWRYYTSATVHRISGQVVTGAAAARSRRP